MLSLPPSSRDCTRRQFVAAAAAASFSAWLPQRGRADEQGAASESKPAQVPVVDTHLHCFAGSKDPRFPYHERAPYRPEQAATPEHLLKLMDKAGVDYAVVVHPEPYQDDHRYLEHCLEVGDGRLKGTCLVFADAAAPGAGSQVAADRGPRACVRSRPLAAIWQTGTAATLETGQRCRIGDAIAL